MQTKSIGSDLISEESILVNQEGLFLRKGLSKKEAYMKQRHAFLVISLVFLIFCYSFAKAGIDYQCT
jgi:hypothetical protein